jgi:MarR family transcriptional regulator, transcriptional regulator for hemolysin
MQKYDYENNIGFIVNRTARAFVKAFDTELRNKVGITFGQWKVIVMLVNQNGLTQKEIADRLGLEGPTLIPVIDKMEKGGLVIRKVDADDRRNNRIYRTEKADALWDRMLECSFRIRQISVKDIPEQNIAIMRSVLDKIWQNLRTEFDDDVDCAIVDNDSNNALIVQDSTANTSENTAVTTTTSALTSSTTTRTKKKN